MKSYLLLTPGPLSTSETVKGKMLTDSCTWDDEYNIDIVQNIRYRLVELATEDTDTYTSVLLQGSGTYAVEAVITCSLSKKDKLLIITNGAYGDRMIEIAKYANLKYDVCRFEETDTPDLEVIEAYLASNPEVTHVAFVHCETTSGIINPLTKLCLTVKKHNKILIVDAMSSFGGIPFDVAELGIDFMISSANKCVQGVPGFAFVIAKTAEMEKCSGNSPSLSLDMYAQWLSMEKQSGKWRFTSPTHVVRAFKQALDELEAEGGIPARNYRYTTNQHILRDGMIKLGFETLLPDNVQSPIITSFKFPSETFSFVDFYNRLKAAGYIIYPGKISTADTFRIGTIGHVFPNDFEVLTQTISNIIK